MRFKLTEEGYTVHVIHEQLYSDVADLVALLKANAQGKNAEILEHRMFKASWTTNSERLEQIASVLATIQSELLPIQNISPVGEKVKFTLNTIRNELEKENRRSLVRVKMWLLNVGFVVCWLAMKYGDLAQGTFLIMLALASVTAILVYFVRCEQCHTSQVQNPLRRLPSLGVPWSILFPSKRCPVCGKERI